MWSRSKRTMNVTIGFVIFGCFAAVDSMDIDSPLPCRLCDTGKNKKRVDPRTSDSERRSTRNKTQNMSALDFEFEQVLGSWLDHCAESLAVQSADLAEQHRQGAAVIAQQLQQLQQQRPPSDDAAAAAAAPTATLADLERSRAALDGALQSQQRLLWSETARATVERFRGMIVDNMERLREIFRVALQRLKRHAPSAAATATTANNSNNAAQIKFAWLAFDALLQTVPLVVVPWCVACRDFGALVERHMPWEAECAWCDAVTASWAPLFAATDRYFGDKLAALTRQRRTTVMVALNLAAEAAERKRQDDADAATRAASQREMAELHALTQRLVVALHKHNPVERRGATVKLEAGVKLEAAHQLLAAAQQLRGVGDRPEQALDVDSEYVPTYVAGAQMGTLVKSESNAFAAGGFGGGDGAAALPNARREPRRRPR